MSVAVIFDMDGVLLDTETIAMRAWMGAATAHGLAFSRDNYIGMIGLSHAATKEYLKTLSWSEEAIANAFDSAWALYMDMMSDDPPRLKQGAVELLDFLAANNVPRGVATSTETTLASRQLERAGILNRMDAVIGGDQVTRGKPAPDIFLLAASKLNSPPADCIVLEDSDHGIRAALAAGMKVIWAPDICEVSDQTKAQTLTVVSSLDRAIPHVQKSLTANDYLKP